MYMASMHTKRKIEHFKVSKYNMKALTWSTLMDCTTRTDGTTDGVVVVRHGDKSSQGGFSQRAVTHVTGGAKSERGGRRDASLLEMYTPAVGADRPGQRRQQRQQQQRCVKLLQERRSA
ncbi:hypothetical protein F2P81_020433 [Scophthalmus maximus]|uniref:Uncharacterized protein n=1 Tax=Scophthalmus maximus TaxID=52904 RepID=A0A6A4S9K7_SCOMX|nr:hypothetical protein F2P81_020433 [Scophthalmus maximus]